MPCTPTQIELQDGTKVTAIVCTRTPRCKCGRKAYLLCDWKTPKEKSGTCDKAICDRCTTKPARDKDLCPAHAEQWKAHPRFNEKLTLPPSG